MGRPLSCLLLEEGALIGSTDKGFLFALEPETGRLLASAELENVSGCPKTASVGGKTFLFYPGSGLIMAWNGLRLTKAWGGPPFLGGALYKDKLLLWSESQAWALERRGAGLAQTLERPKMGEKRSAPSIFNERETDFFIVGGDAEEVPSIAGDLPYSFLLPDWSDANPGDKRYLTAVNAIRSLGETLGCYLTLIACDNLLCTGSVRHAWRLNFDSRRAVWLALKNDYAYLRLDDGSLIVADARDGRTAKKIQYENSFFIDGYEAILTSGGIAFKDEIGNPLEPDAFRDSFAEYPAKDGTPQQYFQIPVREVFKTDANIRVFRSQYYFASVGFQDSTEVGVVEETEAHHPLGVKRIRMSVIRRENKPFGSTGFGLYEGKAMILKRGGGMELFDLDRRESIFSTESGDFQNPPEGIQTGGSIYYASPQDYSVAARDADSMTARWVFLSADRPTGPPILAGGAVAVQLGGQLRKFNPETGTLLARVATGCGDMQCEGFPTAAGSTLITVSPDGRLAGYDANSFTIVWTGFPIEGDAEAIPVDDGLFAVAYGRESAKKIQLCRSDGPSPECGEAPSLLSPTPVAGWGIVGYDPRARAVNLIGRFGDAQWAAPSGAPTSPFLVDILEGAVFFGDDEKYFRALNLTSGAALWSQKSGLVRGAAALRDGVVYYGSDDRHVYAAGAATGHQIWSHNTGYVDQSVVLGQSNLLVQSKQFLYLLDLKSGERKWAAEDIHLNEYDSDPSSGLLYGVDESALRLISEDSPGQIKSFGFKGRPLAPLRAPGGIVLASDATGLTQIVDLQSGKAESKDFRGGVRLQPAVTNGRFYLVTDSGALFCLEK